MYTNFFFLLLWNYWTSRDSILKLIHCYKFKDSKGKFKNLYIIQLFYFFSVFLFLLLVLKEKEKREVRKYVEGFFNF